MLTQSHRVHYYYKLQMQKLAVTIKNSKYILCRKEGLKWDRTKKGTSWFERYFLHGILDIGNNKIHNLRKLV